MNPKSLILIAVAVAGVVGVVFFTRSFLAGITEQAQQAQVATVAVPTASILVANKELPVGTILTVEHLDWQVWPERGLNDAYFQQGKQTQKDLIGKVVRSPINRGEPMTQSAIVAQGERGFLAAVLSPGMRAATVKLSPVAGIGGFIFPGDRVDVILTHKIEVSRSEKYTAAETVFQNVRVLAVDQRSEVEGDKVQIAKTATLEVTPKMAEKVAMLEHIGMLSLSLRSLVGGADEQQNANPDSPPISRTLSHTLGHEVSQFLPQLNAEEPAGTVRVSRGNQHTMVETNLAARAKKKNSDTPLESDL